MSKHEHVDSLDADKAGFAPSPFVAHANAADPAALEHAAELEGVYHGMTLPNEDAGRGGAKRCQRCEFVPAPLEGPGVLLARTPHTHTLGKILCALAASNWTWTEDAGVLRVRANEGSLALLLSTVSANLSRTELTDTLVRFQPDGQPETEACMLDVRPLATVAARARSAWLLGILREHRLTSYFQPIVGTEGGNRIFGYECLLRGMADETVMAPGPMFELARQADLIFQLDLAARRSAIVGASEHGIRDKVFVNFAPNSIYDPKSCLRSTVAMIDEVGLRRDQVVFEITEGDRLPEARHLKRIVNYYRDEGFEVALDDVGSGYSSLTTLVGIRPDYVKIDMELIRGVDASPVKAVVAEGLVSTARTLGMRTIAEGIETQGEYEWARARGVDFVQGYLFGRPAPTPVRALGAS